MHHNSGVTGMACSASKNRVAEMRCVEEGFIRCEAIDRCGRRVESGKFYPSVKY
jgi:hypothetical protein